MQPQPLLPSAYISTHTRAHAVLRRVYATISRTQPISTTHPTHRPTAEPASHGIWGTSRGQGSSVGHLVYRAVGVWAVLGVSYVVGVVAGPMSSGVAVSSALLVGAVSSLLTGFCYLELVTWVPGCSGQLVTATYQLVGELAAWMLGALHLLTAATCLSAVSKALSSTMDAMVGGKVELFVTANVGLIPGTGVAPDFIAAGAALSVTVILAMGLQQSGFLRLIMNVTTVVAFMFFVGVGSAHAEQIRHIDLNKTSGTPEFPSVARMFNPVFQDIVGLLTGAGVCCALFSGFYEIGRRGKILRHGHRVAPLAVSVAIGTTFLSFFALGIVLTLMTGNVLPATGAPLLQALQYRDVGWARLILGSFQVVILCLALVEAAEPMTRQLVTLARDGFLPAQLANMSTRTHAPSNAHLLAGGASAILGLLFSHTFLLQVLSSSVLVVNVTVVVLSMYRRHRCMYGSLVCAVSTVTASLACSRTSTMHAYNATTVSLTSTHQPPRHHSRTIQCLKDGLRVLPASRVRPMVRSGPDTRDRALLLQEEELPPCSTLQQLENSTKDRCQGSQDKNCESDSGASGNETDTDNEVKVDDIDAAVLEYQKVKVATLDTSSPRVPTVTTARRALLSLLGITALLTVVAAVIVYGWEEGGNHPVLVALWITSLCLAVLLLVLLARTPTLKQSHSACFTVPASPWLPAVALLLNLCMLVQVLGHAWPFILVYTIAAVTGYAIYGSRHSQLAEQKEMLTIPRRPPEVVIHLEPLLPPTLMPTLLQAPYTGGKRALSKSSFLTQVDTVVINT